jgi:putative metallohydrolase (TIGR04338 family)
VPASERDSQRSKVYAAEAQVARVIDARLEFPTVRLFGSEVVVPDDLKFGDVASVQRYVDSVLGLNWVQARWPAAAARPVSVRARRGAGKAHYELATATIALPPFERGGRWGLRELVVLHELAHHLDDGARPPHGPQFPAAVLMLVSELIGAEAEFLLRTTYLENGVSAAGPTL